MAVLTVWQRFGTARRHMVRYREVADILVKHGFESLVEQSGLRKFASLPLRIFKFSKNGTAHLSTPQRVRLAAEELGPTAVKLGQLLSMRPDLIPPELAQELQKLQDLVRPFSFSEVQSQIQTELSSFPEEVFATFEKEPLASASLSQVHRATLHSGEEVAVKIQRPDIKRKVAIDLEILSDIAHIAQRRTTWGKIYDLEGIVEEFSNVIYEELDFVNEGHNADQFRHNFENDSTVHIPKVYWDYTTGHILTSELLKGVKITNFAELEAKGLDRKVVADNFTKAILQQIFEHGFFHSDPHPGNVMVLEGETIAFMDFGMVGYLDEELKNQVGNFTIALVQRDLNSITKNLVDMGIVSQQIDVRSLKRDISRLIRRYYNVPMSRISVGKALNEALALAYKYHVKVPADITLLSKSMVTMESIAQQLDPDLSIVNVAEPFGKKLIRERFSPQHLRKSFTHSFAELVNLTENLPRQLNRVARVVGDGNLELKVRSVPNETNTSRGEGFGNRLALAIVVAASIVGSVILLQMKRGPMLFDLPILGIVGLFVSLILGIWLVISIASSSRL